MAGLLRYALLAGALLLAGCAADASGPQFSALEAAGDRGVIYIYALGGFAGYGESPIIEVDGREVGRLKPKGFLAADVDPGTHRVVMKSVIATIPMPGRPVSVAVPAGGNAYVRIDTKYDGLAFSPSGPIPMYSNVIGQVPPETGAGEIRSTRASTS